MKQNVRMLRYKFNSESPWLDATSSIYTYEHPEYLEEGTLVRVDLSGCEYEGEITYQGHAYDGKCKPILGVLSSPTPVVVV